MNLVKEKNVSEIFATYPKAIQGKVSKIKSLIIEVGYELDLENLTETTRWGEPSFISRKGTPLRISWSPKRPDQYGVFVQCSSHLIPALRSLYPSELRYDGSRGIIFNPEESLPEKILRKFIRAALTYHEVKKDPFCGMN